MGTTRDTLGTADDGGVTLGIDKPHTYNDLDENEKKRLDADIRATNIVLQGLPKYIYKLVNHNTKAKAIWDNVKMLLAGFELTKEDRESQLYDEFECFEIIPGKNITDYYVRFHKLVNDMRNIKMTMPNIQLNSKFVNNMTPEWDRFVTAIKLNKGLKETNREQLYAYLKQYEKHAAYDRLINDRFNPTTNDPLALPLHVHTSQNPHSIENLQLDSGYTQTDQMIENHSNQVALLAQQFRASLPQTNNQLQTTSNTRNQATVQDGRVVIQNVQGRQNQNQRNFAQDVDDEPTAQTIFMANLSLTVSSLQQVGPSNASILSEVLNLENAIDHHEIPNEDNEESIVPSGVSSVQYDDYMLHENSVMSLMTHSPQHLLSIKISEKDIVNPNPFHLKKAKMVQPTLYDGDEIFKPYDIPVIVHDSEETLEMAETTRQKMSEKMNNPESVEKRVRIIPPNYSKENFLATFIS
nr:retrovirus-related Pol polyprotein from transposon TNT 1-94 [Tanacetum cinerariifolium]